MRSYTSSRRKCFSSPLAKHRCGGGVPTWRNTGVQSVPTPKNSNALRASMYHHTHNTTDANFVFFWRSSSCGAAGALDRCSLPHVLPQSTHSSHSSSSSVSVNKKIRFAKQRCPACPPPAKQACPREKSVPRKTFSSRTCTVSGACFSHLTALELQASL